MTVIEALDNIGEFFIDFTLRKTKFLQGIGV
jgi:hypothetical protein